MLTISLVVLLICFSDGLRSRLTTAVKVLIKHVQKFAKPRKPPTHVCLIEVCQIRTYTAFF